MADPRTLEQRINEYLCNGGLFNPELMQPMAVRDLLIDCRQALLATPSPNLTTLRDQVSAVLERDEVLEGGHEAALAAVIEVYEQAIRTLSASHATTETEACTCGTLCAYCSGREQKGSVTP